MSNKTHENATRTILAICKDAYGNGISGNEVRSMQFLALAIKTLDAQAAALAAKNDVRALKNLERVIQEGHELADKFVPFNGVNVSESIDKWAARGLTPSALDSMTPEELAKAGVSLVD